MHKKLFKFLKPLMKPLLIVALAITLVFGQADGALAARQGGRIGGGSFRAPSRPYSPPSRTYQPPSGGYGYYPGGGGFGFPFLIPIFGFGGFGSLFTILIFISVASFLVNSLRRIGSSDTTTYEVGGSPTVSVARLQVGLMAAARYLQSDLNRIATTADTSTSAGLTQVLQETTLSLLRHPEYWAYGGAEVQQGRLEAAEAQFNRLALAERSKLAGEALSNVNNQIKRAPAIVDALPSANGEFTLENTEPGEYIVASVIVATQGKLQLPTINSTEDVRRAITQIGSIPSEQLMAIEIIWTPQAEGETLTSDEMVVAYPNLKVL